MSTRAEQGTMFAPRPRAHARWSVGPLACRVLLIALVVASRATASATARADDQQRVWLPAAPTEDFAGEISYSFDSLLNRTTAAYVAPLRNDDFLHRILFATPTVHAIKASYQFDGRSAWHTPDSIRVLLVSDEFTEAPQTDFLFDVDREITINVGRAAVHHVLSISRRIELDSTPRAFANQITIAHERPEYQRLPAKVRAHITSRSTAWFPICEFLSLIEQPTLEGSVAGRHFSLNHKVLTGLKLFAAEMPPAGAQERSVDCTPK